MRKLKEMSGEEYDRSCKEVGLERQVDAAEFFGISRRSSNSYANGTPVPHAIARLLRLMIKYGLKASDL
jgi:hypothetical protein